MQQRQVSLGAVAGSHSVSQHRLDSGAPEARLVTTSSASARASSAACEQRGQPGAPYQRAFLLVREKARAFLIGWFLYEPFFTKK